MRWPKTKTRKLLDALTERVEELRSDFDDLERDMPPDVSNDIERIESDITDLEDRVNNLED